MSDTNFDFQKALAEMPTPEWVVNMINHYNETRTYRVEDLKRVLGENPFRGVSTNMDIDEYFKNIRSL